VCFCSSTGRRRRRSTLDGDDRRVVLVFDDKVAKGPMLLREIVLEAIHFAIVGDLAARALQHQMLRHVFAAVAALAVIGQQLTHALLDVAFGDNDQPTAAQVITFSTFGWIVVVGITDAFGQTLQVQVDALGF
jgi:hypothetical protein